MISYSQIETEYVTLQRDSDLWQSSFLIKMLASDNIRLIRISTIIQFATLLEEFRFLLEGTISGVDLLEMELKYGILALYPYHSHLTGFRRVTITCVQLANFTSRMAHHLGSPRIL